MAFAALQPLSNFVILLDLGSEQSSSSVGLITGESTIHQKGNIGHGWHGHRHFRSLCAPMSYYHQKAYLELASLNGGRGESQNK